MVKRYEQYCPLAHALDLVGDRWALLVVRELMRGPKRYTDLVDGLPGIGTNILAARLRDLEQAGLVTRRTLPPPAASKVYELTDYGHGLQRGACASWRSGAPARSARRRRSPACSTAGWPTRWTSCSPRSRPPAASSSASTTRWPPWSTARSGAGRSTTRDVVVEADAPSLYDMFVNRRLDLVSVTGDRDLLERLVAAAPPRLDESVTV